MPEFLAKQFNNSRILFLEEISASLAAIVSGGGCELDLVTKFTNALTSAENVVPCCGGRITKLKDSACHWQKESSKSNIETAYNDLLKTTSSQDTALTLGDAQNLEINTVAYTNSFTDIAADVVECVPNVNNKVCKPLLSELMAEKPATEHFHSYISASKEMDKISMDVAYVPLTGCTLALEACAHLCSVIEGFRECDEPNSNGNATVFNLAKASSRLDRIDKLILWQSRAVDRKTSTKDTKEEEDMTAFEKFYSSIIIQGAKLVSDFGQYAAMLHMSTQESDKTELAKSMSKDYDGLGFLGKQIKARTDFVKFLDSGKNFLVKDDGIIKTKSVALALRLGPTSRFYFAAVFKFKAEPTPSELQKCVDSVDGWLG